MILLASIILALGTGVIFHTWRAALGIFVAGLIVMLVKHGTSLYKNL